MEANQINGAPTTISETATGKSRMSKGQIIGMVILTIVALAGVAFGVFGMMEKDKAEKNLAIKITEAGGKVTEMVTDKITSVDENGTVTEITDTNVTTEAINPEDYIYIGEWGLKIKIPEELKNVSYKFQQKTPGDVQAGSLLVTGVLNSVEGMPNYAIIYGSGVSCPGLGAIYRVEKPGELVVNVVEVFSDDNYNYYWSGPQSYCEQSTAKEEMNTSRVIQEMLTNRENYSKI